MNAVPHVEPVAHPPRPALPSRRHQPTMLGMPIVPADGAPASTPPPSTAPASTDPHAAAGAPAPRPGRAGHGTMLGMPAVTLPPVQPAGSLGPQDAFAPTHPPEPQPVVMPSALQPASPVPSPAPASDLLPSPFAGMSSPTAVLPVGLGAAAPPAPAPAYAPVAPEPPPSAPVVAAPLEPEPFRGPGMGPARPAASPATPVGRAFDEASPEFTRPTPRGRYDVTYDEPPQAATPSQRPPSRGIAGLVFAGFLGMAALTAIGAAVYVFFFGEDDVRAQVDTVEGEQQLVVDVREAATGTKVRFQGREVPLASGRALFRLAPDALHLGENEIALDVVAPDGAVETHQVVLSVAYRVRAELDGLDDDPPVLRVVVDAAPGSTVQLDGAPLTLDASGRGVKAVPVEAATEGQSISLSTRYRIVPPGGHAVEGAIETRMPLAMLHLDRPGRSLVTDRAEVEIAGTVGPRATITVGERTVATLEGRFFTRWPLPALGDQEVTIRVREPDKAPRREVIHLRRVPDLVAEAARYPVEPGLDYARIAQNPGTYRGRHVAFEGFAYHVEVADGRSVLQILVRDCPGGQRCPLWVVYPAATDAVRSSWVRVLGEVAGEQQFRAANGGQILTVPRVDAAFVLPASR